MIKDLKGNLIFYIGVIVFSITILTEHLFSIDTDISSFVKGAGCGLIIGGVIKYLERKGVKHWLYLYKDDRWKVKTTFFL